MVQVRLPYLAFLIYTLVMGAADRRVYAQDPDPIFDAAGFIENRAYEELAPFESIDTLTGNVLLTFTDLVLPGDAGYDIEIQRVYNSKPSDVWVGGREWDFGIAGVPMRVIVPPGTPPASDPNPEVWWPIFRTVDGARHQGIPISSSSPASTRFRTKEFWEYRTTDRVLKLPNGLICTYNADGLLSEISYARGLLATVAWTSSGPPEVASITQHVGGETRTVTFSGSTTKTMRSGARTWTYSFSSTHLMTVQPPTGPPWQFTYRTSGIQSLATVTTPQGGRISYEWMNAPFRKPLGGVDHYSWALVQRSTSMNVEPGTWSYSYLYYPTTNRLVTRVDGPDNIRKSFEYEYVEFETPAPDAHTPRLRSTSISNSSETLETQDFDYRLGALVDWRDGDQLLKTQQVARRGSGTYVTRYTYQGGSYANYGQPSEIEETGDFTQRTHRTLYTTLREPFPCCGSDRPYMPLLVHTESISSPGGASFVKEAGFDDRGFQDEETVYGIRRRFSPDARNNRVTDIDALNHQTHHTYRWGVRENTTTPEHTIQRTINSDSTVASERRNGVTTSYQYDDLFRRTLLTPPEGHATETVFEGGNTITVRRGSATKVYTLDGFGRVVHERHGTTSSAPRLRYAFDAYGRKSFESLPYDIGTGEGTTWRYDALGRVLSETYADATRRTYQYPHDREVRVVDEQLRVTTQRWEVSGNPENRRLASITEASWGEFRYSYNALGRMVAVQQPGGTVRSWLYFSGTDRIQSETHPESGTTTYQYDAAGQLRQRTDAGGRVFTHTYDRNGRLIGVDAPGTADDQQFDYDDADNRVLAANGYVTSRFTFDGANRLTRRSDSFAGLTGEVTTSYTYTGWDTVDVITHPSGMTIDYDYDPQGRLLRVERGGSQALFTVVSRHPSGAPASVQFGNGVTERRTFDDRHRPNLIDLPGLNLDYDYYPAGSVRRIADSRASMTQELVYDALDRLERYHRGFVTIPYAYDLLGNRTLAGTTAYTYNPNTLRANHLTYDEVGRVVGDEQGTYTYTPFGMTQTATVNGATTSYRYDADNLRKITIPPSGPTEYVVHGEGTQVLTEAIGLNGVFSWRYEYVYAEGRLVARLRPDPVARVSFVTTPTNNTNVEEGNSAVVRIQVRTDDGSPTREPISVPWRLFAQSAFADDFQSTTSGTFVVPTGTPTPHILDLPLATIEDSRDENDESFLAMLESSPGVLVEGVQQTVVTIIDDDVPPPIHIGFLQPQYSTTEASGVVQVGVRISTEDNQPTTRGFTVRYRANPGSATPGEDYQHVEGVQTILAGTNPSDIPFPLTIVNNGLYEPTESFTFSFTVDPLDPPVVVDAASTTIQILDDESVPGPLPIVGFTTAAQSVSEAAGSVSVALVVNTQGLPATWAPVEVQVATQNGTAVAGSDYTAMPPVSYTIPTGTANGAVLQAPIGITNDGIAEASEQFTVAIVGGYGGQPGIMSQTITILDDDAITVAFNTTSAQVSEASGGVPVTIVVTTASGQPTPRAVTLQYGTLQGSAIDGLDYTGVLGSTTIPAGTANGTSVSAVLPVFNDAMDEPNESFTVHLASSDATAGAPLTAVIVDDDAPGATIEIDLTAAQQSISEAAGSVPISIRIITANGAPTTALVSLNFWTVQGSATPNVDYQHVSSGVPINAGTASGTIVTSALLIGNDTLDEPAETFTVNVSTALPAVSAVPAQTVSIIDNDPGPFGFTAGGQGGDESGTPHSEKSGELPKAPTPNTWQTIQPSPPVKQPLIWKMGSPDDGASSDASPQKGAR